MTEKPETQWHLDKRVPVALILTMAAQVAVVIWGAAVMFKDIEANRAGIAALNGRVEVLDRGAGAQAVQLGRMSSQIEAQSRTLHRMDQTLGDLARYLMEKRQ